VQAFCSSGVPLRACANAPLDMESDNRLIDRTSLSIVFLTLHFLTEGNFHREMHRLAEMDDSICNRR
jgi:hypothetical protein